MKAEAKLAYYLAKHQQETGRIVDFNPSTDNLYHFDFTAANDDLDESIFTDVARFSYWIKQKLTDSNCRFGIGGYMEQRVIYGQPIFTDACEEPRSIHLGIDIWADAGTAVYAPLKGTIHSFKNNDNPGDYGPTIILEHNLDGLCLFSLYGHLSTDSITGITPGGAIEKNQLIGWLGNPAENGGWPPHLHFQLMFDMEGMNGDYPGVCRRSELAEYLQNVPDPQQLLQFPKAVNR